MKYAYYIVFCALLSNGTAEMEALMHADQPADGGLLTIEDLLSQETFHRRSPLAVTADGRYLAVTVVGAHEEAGEREQLLTPQGVSPENAGTDIVLIDLESDGQQRPFAGVTRTANTSFTPVFSPDGRYLAAYVRTGTRYLRPAIYDLKDDVLKIFDATPAQAVTGWSIPAWLPDGSGLIFQMPGFDPEAPSDRLAVNVQRHALPDALSDRPDADAWDSRLALLTVATGELRVLYSGFVSTWRVAPDGGSVAVNAMRAPGTGEVMPYSKLAVIDIATGVSTDLGAMPRSIWGPQLAFSRDGNWLGWTAGGAAGMVCLRSRNTFSVRGKWQEAPPGWTPAGAMLLLATDALYRVVPPAGESGGELRAESLVGARANPGWAAAVWNGPPPDVTDGALWLVHNAGVDKIEPESGTVITNYPGKLGVKRAASEAAIFSQRGDRVHRFDLQTGGQSRVFAPRGLPPRQSAQRRTLEWSLPGDRRAAGNLYLPPGHAGQPVPVVVDLYAGIGPRSTAYVIDHRLLTAAGYGVFLPQIPVAVGTDLMREIRIGVDAALAALLESGLADPGRLAIQGQSFGVFAVFSVLTGDDGARFRTAVASNGTMDLLFAHQLGSHWWVEKGQGGMAATPWEHRERYLANAPYWHLDRVNCPVLLIHGEADGSGPMMRMAYQSLKRLEKPVELRVYEGCGHGPSAWPASQQRDFAARVLEWYADHL